MRAFRALDVHHAFRLKERQGDLRGLYLLRPQEGLELGVRDALQGLRTSNGSPLRNDGQRGGGKEAMDRLAPSGGIRDDQVDGDNRP
jgi:hypothetical protein